MRKNKIIIIVFQVKNIMLRCNNNIFRNYFVIIHCHPTKIQHKYKCSIIFAPDELSVTLSILVATSGCIEKASGVSSALPKLLDALL